MKKFILLALVSLSSAAFANNAALRELDMAKAKIDTVVRYVGDRTLRTQLLDALDHIRNAETRLEIANQQQNEMKSRRTIQGGTYICTDVHAQFYLPIKSAVEAITLELQNRCGRSCTIGIEYQSTSSTCEIIGTAYRRGR